MHFTLIKFSSRSLLSLFPLSFLVCALTSSTYISTNMVGCAIRLKKRRPEWLGTLLCSKFFDSCLDHQDLRKNEKNMFCIDCKLCLCKHCLASSTHCLHRLLQICKYVYHDVVRLQDIQKHLDCSRIQTYKINGEKAIHLNPRPQLKDTKVSKSKGGAFCEACRRHIQDLPNRFCSISCKVSIDAEICKDQRHKMIPIPVSEFDNMSINQDKSSITASESSDASQPWLSSVLKPKKLSHKRKGVPRRAPLR